MRPALKSRALRNPALCALMSLAAGMSTGFTAPVYWGQTAYSSGTTYEGTMASAGNWFTDLAGTQVATIAPNTPDDDLVFNTSPANSVGGTVSIDANFSANSFTFNTSGSTIFAQDANRNIILGGGGITVSATSGNVSFGINVNTLSVRLAASQTWTNHSASLLSVRNITSQVRTGPVVLSLNAAGAGNIALPLSISDSLDDPLSLVIDSAGSGVVVMGFSTYSGGTTVNRGKLATSGTSNTGEILLGDTAGASAATLMVNSAAFPNDLTVRSGSSGAKTLVSSKVAGVLSGAITLNDPLSLAAAGKLTTLAGMISGTGALFKEGKGELALAGANTFSGNLVVKSGVVTLTEAGSLIFTVSGPSAANQISGSGAVVLHGAFQINVPEASLVDGTSWPLVANANRTFGPTFVVAGFTQADDVWTNGKGLTFSEATGVLSYKRSP